MPESDSTGDVDLSKQKSTDFANELSLIHNTNNPFNWDN